MRYTSISLILKRVLVCDGELIPRAHHPSANSHRAVFATQPARFLNPSPEFVNPKKDTENERLFLPTVVSRQTKQVAILNDLRAPAGVPHPKMQQSELKKVWRREAQTILVTWQIVRRYEPMKPAFFAASVI